METRKKEIIQDMVADMIDNYPEKTRELVTNAFCDYLAVRNEPVTLYEKKDIESFYDFICTPMENDYYPLFINGSLCLFPEDLDHVIVYDKPEADFSFPVFFETDRFDFLRSKWDPITSYAKNGDYDFAIGIKDRGLLELTGIEFYFFKWDTGEKMPVEDFLKSVVPKREACL